MQSAADFEINTLIEAIAKLTSVNIDTGNLSTESMKQYGQLQGGLNSALSKLLVSVKSYPDLKSNQNFMNLQTPLEGLQNRINVERNRFNSSVSTYN